MLVALRMHALRIHLEPTVLSAICHGCTYYTCFPLCIWKTKAMIASKKVCLAGILPHVPEFLFGKRGGAELWPMPSAAYRIISAWPPHSLRLMITSGERRIDLKKKKNSAWGSGVCGVVWPTIQSWIFANGIANTIYVISRRGMDHGLFASITTLLIFKHSCQIWGWLP